MYQRSINFIKGSPLTTPAASVNASASPEEDYIAPADAAVRLSAYCHCLTIQKVANKMLNLDNWLLWQLLKTYVSLDFEF